MRFYLNLCMVMCVVDFIKSYRVNKHRKHVDDQIEMIREYNEYIHAII